MANKTKQKDMNEIDFNSSNLADVKDKNSKRKKTGEFHNLPVVPRPTKSMPTKIIYDPACGSGALLIKAVKEMSSKNSRSIKPLKN